MNRGNSTMNIFVDICEILSKPAQIGFLIATPPAGG